MNEVFQVIQFLLQSCEQKNAQIAQLQAVIKKLEEDKVKTSKPVEGDKPIAKADEAETPAS
jgi:hypothetical protein